MPEGFEIELGEIELALHGAILPAVQFSPAVLTDKENAAKIEMQALDVGFSPFKALIAQPSLNIKLVRPKLKIIQDLLGPRLAEFELVISDGNNDAIYILEGEKSYPLLNITKRGLGLEGGESLASEYELRTDNDLLIYNFQAAEQSLKSFLELVQNGKISQLKIIEANIIMHDSVYGLLREYKDINIEVLSSLKHQTIFGNFNANIAGRTTKGTFERTVKDKNNFFRSKITNVDFASMLPFLDDDNSLVALKGAGNLAIDIQFNKQNGNIEKGIFTVNEIKANMRVIDDLFPVKAETIIIDWLPELAKFNIRPNDIRVGNSSGKISAQFITGVDKAFGPTLSMSIEAQRVFIYPNDLLAPQTPFDKISLVGWSAPLYGALGIDYLVAQKQSVEIRAKGRADLIRSGAGMQFEVGAEGASADDLKRLWPYFIASEARDWFVANVNQGTLKSGNLLINFPIGTLPKFGETMALPEGAIKANIVAQDVSLIPLKGMKPVKIDGDMLLSVNDNVVTANIKGTKIPLREGAIEVANGAIIIDSKNSNSNLYELSGDISAPLTALIAFFRKYLPNMLDEENIPLKLDSLKGDVKGAIVTTLLFNNEKLENIDYALNGRISNFTSSEALAGYKIDNGQFSFSATQNGYNLTGTTNIAGLNTQFKLDGVLGDKHGIIISGDLSINEIKKLGFDLSEFMSGKIKFAIKLLNDGALQLSADLKNASLNIRDLGISKDKGIKGQIDAKIQQNADGYSITNSVLAFADVLIKGDMLVENGKLQSANFSTFTLSKGDSASLIVGLVNNGISLKIRGKQMDLKPMIGRAFALDRPSAGAPRSTQYDNRLLIDVQLNKAIGFYKTIANNFNLKMDLHGNDMRNVSLQAQFLQNKAVSISTNQIQGGRTMIVAFSDAGTLLRFMNVYPRLVGGKGSLSMTTYTNNKIDEGLIVISDFSIVDEAKIAQIIGNYEVANPDLARGNRVHFNYGKVNFIRKSDRIEITDGVLDGGEIGGTLRGFIYTKKREYDLTGTYIPLFGVNSIFQKIPLFGAILGGREGEGLIGVTFAIRGSLDKPIFAINPASILAPGMFRSLFEFRAREAPQAN